MAGGHGLLHPHFKVLFATMPSSFEVGMLK